MTYYKVLNIDGSCYHGGTGIWPEDQWMPELNYQRLMPCSYGYHILREQDLVYWLGPAIAQVETNDPSDAIIIHDNNKLVVATAKRGPFLQTWNERTQRLFACDCAEHTLHLYESKSQNDNRPRKAIDTARLYINNQATKQELDAAAAAAAAARTASAAAAAAYAAATAYTAATVYAAYAAATAYTAATAAASAYAAHAAASAATSAATAATARTAERAWQTARLMQYLNGGV